MSRRRKGFIISVSGIVLVAVSLWAGLTFDEAKMEAWAAFFFVLIIIGAILFAVGLVIWRGKGKKTNLNKLPKVSDEFRAYLEKRHPLPEDELMPCPRCGAYAEPPSWKSKEQFIINLIFLLFAGNPIFSTALYRCEHCRFKWAYEDAVQYQNTIKL